MQVVILHYAFSTLLVVQQLIDIGIWVVLTGIKDVAKDPDYQGIYERLEKKNASEGAVNELKFFMKHVDDVAMQLTLFQQSVNQHKNMFLVDADWTIENAIYLTDDQLNREGFTRLQARLQLQELVLQEYLPKKFEVRRELHVLKLISFLVPFLVAMKKRMKIPDMTKTHFFLPSGLSSMCCGIITSYASLLLKNNIRLDFDMFTRTDDKVRTERELPPLMLSSDCQCPNFDSETNFYFHLHGGISSILS